MPRWLIFLFLLGVGCMVALVALFPRIKQGFLGRQYQTQVEILSATLEEVPLVNSPDKQLRLIVSLRLTTPIGEKPQALSELALYDKQGKPVYLDWTQERPWDDDFDTGLTSVEFQNVYLLPTFRKGVLKRGESELCAFEVPNPPFKKGGDAKGKK